LPNILIELSRKYFDILGTTPDLEEKPIVIKKEIQKQDVHQCPECLTLYNSAFGDVVQGIPKDVLFVDLPEDYCCSLCESPKINFIDLAVIH
jgi:rubredoxin